MLVELVFVSPRVVNALAKMEAMLSGAQFSWSEFAKDGISRKILHQGEDAAQETKWKSGGKKGGNGWFLVRRLKIAGISGCPDLGQTAPACSARDLGDTFRGRWGARCRQQLSPEPVRSDSGPARRPEEPRQKRA